MADNIEALVEEIKENIFSSSKICLGSEKPIIPTKIFEGGDSEDFNQSHVRIEIPKEKLRDPTWLTYQLSMDLAESIKYGELDILIKSFQDNYQSDEIETVDWNTISSKIVSHDADLILLPAEILTKLRMSNHSKLLGDRKILIGDSVIPYINSSNSVEFDDIYLINKDKVELYQKLSMDMKEGDEFPQYWNLESSGRSPIEVRYGEKEEGIYDIFVRTVYKAEAEEGAVKKISYPEI